MAGDARHAGALKSKRNRPRGFGFYSFSIDDEIHVIVNFNYKTATKISIMGNLLAASVYEYVGKEEHDAKFLFSGMLLKEYHVNIDNGEIEEIQ